MDKKIAGLIGAVTGLATASGAQAAVNPPASSEALQASSYADLLAPIANPVELLNADNAARAQEVRPAADFQVAQSYYPYYGYYGYNNGYYNYPYYHHHHHNSYYRPYSYHHHHHHHHHNSAFIGIPGVGGIVVPR